MIWMLGVIITVLVLIVISAFCGYMGFKNERRLKEANQEALSISTKIIYVKTIDKILFKVYELSLITKEIRTTTFLQDEIPIKRFEQLNTWLETDVLDFLSDKQWVNVRTVDDDEVELAYNEIRTLCIQDEPFVNSVTDIHWCLQLINSENEGFFIVAIDKKPKNYIRFESILSQLFNN